MTLQAFTLLAALATLSCVAGAARSSQLAFVGGGMLTGALLLLPAVFGLPFAPLVTVEPTQVALLLVLFALAQLRPNLKRGITLFTGGVLAVVWLLALRGVGWPLFAALPFVTGAAGVAAVAGMKREFLPPVLREEVTLLVLVGGLLLALVPGVLSGWDSAQVLQGSSAAAAVAGKNVVWVAAGFVVFGALFAWWKTNRRWSK